MHIPTLSWYPESHCQGQPETLTPVPMYKAFDGMMLLHTAHEVRLPAVEYVPVGHDMQAVEFPSM